MSAIKELIIDYEEEFEKSILDFTAEDWFKIQMENVKPSNTPIPEIEKFFYDIMPQHRHFSYWLMVKEGNVNSTANAIILQNLQNIYLLLFNRKRIYFLFHHNFKAGA